MFNFWGSQDQETHPPPRDGPPHSWYPTSVVNPSTRSSTSSSHSPNVYNQLRTPSPSHVSPTEAAEIVSYLKNKNVDELRKLLTDKEAYQKFLLSFDQVKTQNNVRDELRQETLQLAGENLEKEPRIIELRNQCRIIRTSELAAAQEKLNDLEKRKKEILRCYSPASVIQRLQEALNKTEEESEALDKQLLDREIELGAFVQKCKKFRKAYHRRALTHLAAKTTAFG